MLGGEAVSDFDLTGRIEPTRGSAVADHGAAERDEPDERRIVRAQRHPEPIKRVVVGPAVGVGDVGQVTGDDRGCGRLDTGTRTSLGVGMSLGIRRTTRRASPKPATPGDGDRGMAEQTPPTRELVYRAEALADEMGHPLVGSEHLLLAITEADDDLAAHRILRETGALPAVRQYLDEMFGRRPS